MHEWLIMAVLRTTADNAPEMNTGPTRDLIYFRECLAARVGSSIEADEWDPDNDREGDRKKFLADLEKSTLLQKYFPQYEQKFGPLQSSDSTLP